MNNNNKRKIFFDGEFTKLTTEGVDFLSVAFITDTGKELYLEIKQNLDKCDSWVTENVVPYLSQEKVSTEKAVKIITEFVEKEYGEDKPILVADVNQFDWMGLCKIFGVWSIPFYYIPLDFSTLLYAKGIDIDINRIDLLKSYGYNTTGFKQHNALIDVRALKLLWSTLM